MHELAHLVGFYHEHQRSDRDEYINVRYDNIVPHFRKDFEKYNFTTYGEYDFGSIMHYPLGYYATSNTLLSMEVLSNVTVPEGVSVGTLHTLSTLDIRKAKEMYKCQPSEF